jgi:predicted secreted protein
VNCYVLPDAGRTIVEEGDRVAGRDTTAGSAGIGLGGILVIAGIVIALIWSVWLGVLVAVIGLVAFGGFAKGKWY